MKFKAGQIVRLINNRDISAKIGATAEVMGRSGMGNAKVVWNRRDGRAANQSDGGYADRRFELISDGNKPMVEGEFSLDEISHAEDILASLQSRTDG